MKIQKLIISIVIIASPLLLFSDFVQGSGTYHYYLPYFTGQPGYWTGLGLSNCNTSQNANVTVRVYNQYGQLANTQSQVIRPDGQQSFLVSSGSSQEGWMFVSSNQPLTGLSSFGTTGAYNYMAEITLIQSTSKMLQVPHVAQNNEWDTSIFLCNPNSSSTTAILTFVNAQGQTNQPQSYSMSGMGSIKIDLSAVLGGVTAANGKVKISTTQGVAAFALYTNLKSFGRCYAGINAIEPERGDGGESCPVEIYPGSSCALIPISSSFSSVISLYGQPDNTWPDDTEWINYFAYPDSGIRGAVEDLNYDEVLDDNEPVIMVVVIPPYPGKTLECNGIGSSKNSILAEFGNCDESDYDPSVGMIELYYEGIIFSYDLPNKVFAIAVFDTSYFLDLSRGDQQFIGSGKIRSILKHFFRNS